MNATPVAAQGQDQGSAARRHPRERRRSCSHAAGYTNVTRLTKALDGAALREALQGVHIVGIRSRTQLTEEVFEAADRLIAVGCFCVGTNQVDLDAARARGIPVFNAPFSNTRCVAELVIGEIVMLLRRIFPRSVAARMTAAGTRVATDSLRGARQDARHRRLRQHRHASCRRSPRPWACG